jgi:hypothetical protein
VEPELEPQRAAAPAPVSDGSGSKHRWIVKNVTNCNSFLNY